MSEEKEKVEQPDEALQPGQTCYWITGLLCIAKWKNMAIQAADPVAAERAKRYIWSRIERNQANDWRAVR